MEEHEQLLGNLAETINAFRESVDKEPNALYAEALTDLQKVFAYLYVFGGNPNDSDSNEQE
jgi:hypothetical protein